MTNFNKVHHKNPINAQNAGLIDLCRFFFCKYSQIRAHKKGQNIIQRIPKNNHKIIHIIHHRFHRFDHQNFLVPSIGR